MSPSGIPKRTNRSGSTKASRRTSSALPFQPTVNVSLPAVARRPKHFLKFGRSSNQCNDGLMSGTNGPRAPRGRKRSSLAAGSPASETKTVQVGTWHISSAQPTGKRQRQLTKKRIARARAWGEGTSMSFSPPGRRGEGGRRPDEGAVSSYCSLRLGHRRQDTPTDHNDRQHNAGPGDSAIDLGE